MWLLLGILSFCFFQVSCQYRKSSVVGNRTFAIKSCKLARPSIIFSDGENKVNLTKGILGNQEKAWIGYTNIYEIFQYLGCVLTSNLNQTIPHTEVNTTNDPGQCYSACKHSRIFGMRTTTDSPDCFCFDTDVVSQINSRENNCDIQCANSWFACGSAEYLSLYKKAQIEQTKAYSEKCLLFNHSKGTNVWRKCDKPRKGVCIKDENDRSPLKTSPSTWKRAMDNCFHKDEYPISNRSILSGQLNYTYWIANINTLIISDSEDFPTTKVSKYGYIERKQDDIYLRFTNNSNEKMIALCNEALTNQPPQTKQVTGDNNTGVYIAVPLVISACVCVAVVVVLCYRKKRRQQPEKTEHKEILPRQNPTYNHVEDEVCYMNTVDHNDGVSMALENSTNNLKELRQDETNPKLNSQINSMNTGDARGIYEFAQEVGDAVPNINIPEHSYFVLEKVKQVSDVYSKVGTYVDLSPGRNTKPSDHATNTYNKTTDNNRDVDNYDHIGAAKSVTVNEDGHYNTTFNDDKGESFYDTTNLSGPRHAVNDETYDSTRCPNDYDLANSTCNKTGNYVNTNCKDVYSFADVTQN